MDAGNHDPISRLGPITKIALEDDIDRAGELPRGRALWHLLQRDQPAGESGAKRRTSTSRMDPACLMTSLTAESDISSADFRLIITR